MKEQRKLVLSAELKQSCRESMAHDFRLISTVKRFPNSNTSILILDLIGLIFNKHSHRIDEQSIRNCNKNKFIFKLLITPSSVTK